MPDSANTTDNDHFAALCNRHSKDHQDARVYAGGRGYLEHEATEHVEVARERRVPAFLAGPRDNLGSHERDRAGRRRASDLGALRRHLE